MLFDVLVIIAPWRNGSVGVLHTLGCSSSLHGATMFGGGNRELQFSIVRL